MWDVLQEDQRHAPHPHTHKERKKERKNERKRVQYIKTSQTPHCVQTFLTKVGLNNAGLKRRWVRETAMGGEIKEWEKKKLELDNFIFQGL